MYDSSDYFDYSSEAGFHVSIIPGSLYVIATPIGNLEDISSRAVNVLGNVDLIIAEDTRHSGRLLKKIGVSCKMLSHHDYNEKQRLRYLISRLKNNTTIALITDAGTPLICDPGYQLVAAAHEANIRIIPVPGPSALIGALSVAGLPTDRFVFEGYLPVKQAARMHVMQELATEKRTLVFYEAPHRIMQTLNDAVDCFGMNRSAALVKELTKVHETVIRDTLDSIRNWIKQEKSRQKGEFVLIIKGAEGGELDKNRAAWILRELLHTVSVKQATEITAGILGGYRNDIYKLAISLQKTHKQ